MADLAIQKIHPSTLHHRGPTIQISSPTVDEAGAGASAKRSRPLTQLTKTGKKDHQHLPGHRNRKDLTETLATRNNTHRPEKKAPLEISSAVPVGEAQETKSTKTSSSRTKAKTTETTSSMRTTRMTTKTPTKTMTTTMKRRKNPSLLRHPRTRTGPIPLSFQCMVLASNPKSGACLSTNS